MNDARNERASAENGPQKTAKQLQKEAKKLAKLEKFKQKQEKKGTEKPASVKEKPEVREAKGPGGIENFILLSIRFNSREWLYRCGDLSMPISSIWSLIVAR